MDESDLLIMMRRLGFTHGEFAERLGISTRTLDRQIANGASKRTMHAANWVYLKEMGKRYERRLC